MHETEPKTQLYTELLSGNEKTTSEIKRMSQDINRVKKKTQRLALKA